jgi:RNA polymerase sigma-70 factor (ECF subfamily)
LTDDAFDREMDDTELMRRLANSEAGACAALYDRHAEAVHALLVRIVHDRDIAEDLLQETLLRAWQHASSYDRQRGPVRCWLLGIAHNLALNELRRRRRRPNEIREGPDDDGFSVFGMHPDPTPGPADVAWTGVQEDELRRALDRLQPSQRTAVELYAAGFSQSEIAANLAEPIGTIKSRLRASFRVMRLNLEHVLGDAGPPPDCPADDVGGARGRRGHTRGVPRD